MSSSFTCQVGVFAAERLQARRTGRLLQFWKWGIVEWFFLTFALGAVFVIGQVFEYANLVSEHVGFTSDSYGSAFYLTTGFHALHVTGGLIAFLLVHRPRLRGQELHPPRGDHRDRRLVLLALRRRGLDRPVPRHLRPEIAARHATRHTAPRTELPQHMAKTAPPSGRAARTGRRSPLASVALLVIGLLATGGAYALFTTSATAETASQVSSMVVRGSEAVRRQLRQLPRTRRPGHRASRRP